MYWMYEQVLDFIDNNQDNSLEALKKLVRIPSVAAKGEGIKETADLVEKMLIDAGLQTKVYETSGSPEVS